MKAFKLVSLTLLYPGTKVYPCEGVLLMHL